MTDPHGFLKFPRRPTPARPVTDRLGDFEEVHAGQTLLPLVSEQAARCMDCGIPFCHSGCPLGNLIPEWNAYASHGDWQAAAERLHATNNFPEFTGRLCPAPCEDACVLAINADPVTIKNVEQAIADEAWERGYAPPQPPQRLSGKTVGVIGSGPAGLAAAQQLTRIGHTVAVYERDDRVGGLLRYGIPDFKLDKRQLDRRIEQMRAEGTIFRTGVDVGTDVDAAELLHRHDAIIIAVGATEQRELPVPGRELPGIHQAMDYLTHANRVVQGSSPQPALDARDRHVVIIGGGDTATDCLGTALRQQAASVTQLDINPQPGETRPETQPWPTTHPRIYRISHAHQEARHRAGADPRLFGTATLRFEPGPAGRVGALHVTLVEVGTRAPRPGTEHTLPAELVLLALGFTGPPHHTPLAQQLRLAPDHRGNYARTDAFTAHAGHAGPAGPAGQDDRRAADRVFITGDAGRGQSLVVWAIAEGRATAAATHQYLTGHTDLPAPITPTT